MRRGGRAALLLLMALGDEGRAAQRPCPRPFAASAARQEATLALLSTSEAGRGLLTRARGPLVLCFAAAPAAAAAVTPEGLVLMDARLDGAEAAARLGHLLYHLEHREVAAICGDRARRSRRA
jgi:hypothetical protein